MTSPTPTAAAAPASRIPLALPILLIVGGLAGLIAAFNLTLDDLALLKNPDAALSCSVNAFIQCGKNIQSPQGNVFGFPNPILGLMMFPAPIAVGVGLLARARFAAWFWWLFLAGMTFAMGFVLWLASESIFSLHTLCPWCALVYLAVTPMWFATVLHVFREGYAGTALAKVGRVLTPWIPLLTILVYLAIFGTAQLQLGLLQSLL
ncbi:MAG: hypothetical protein CMH36_06660 [Microbacterium sp.]|uniref:Vitamin K epoxide reductase family protein n=1 Tax=Microbacterium ginsengisoli TaxID=400772 RepID=A0A0F0LXP3_9MICO|nr:MULTISPECIES: vitamin K epoxide reductase family protein [Microbacterium]MAL06492.1 hypothetical protein [Microbacterium sp.]MCK9919658.1 vitamin K epoxide reductase family protein [Microbacteriaceae bacterium K1510]KJL36151.1 Vitamin K epoxide reductase family protein [Microbacterium ginsengisoli]KQR93989.1 hypothetical protein ASF93_03455 [Microbacterium sp. Leaf347]KQR97149.1 hypothetical protein ASG00_12885 [Microbacterium sp. Leaf351]